MDDLRVLRATAKNFQCLEEKQIDINGKSLLVIGKNGSGKSSLIRIMKSASNTNDLPEKSIKDGEEYAEISVTYGNDNEEYTYHVYFSPEHQKGRLVVKDKDGNQITGVTSQRNLLGDFTFDPFEFIRLGKSASGKTSKSGVREQIDILKQFLSDDEKLALNKLDKEYEDLYNERTIVNRELKKLELEAEGAEITQEDLEKYSKDRKEEEQELIDRISKVSKASANFARVEDGVNSAKLRIKELEKEILELKDKVEKGEEWLSKNENPNVEELNSSLSEVRKHNEKHDYIKAKLNLISDIKEKRSNSGKATERLDRIKIEKKEIIAKSNLPIKNLTFDDDQVLFNGLPLDFDHHPKSHVIGIGVQIAMAKNPRLKTIFIDDGSLLDEQTLNWLFDKCEKEGYQIICEMVDWKADDMHVEYMEKFLSE